MKKSFIVLSALLLLSSCTKIETIIEMPTLPEFPEHEIATFAEPKGIVAQPDTQTFWTNNQLNTNNDEGTQASLANGVKFRMNLKRYNGLKDKTVEDKINQNIQELADQMSIYTTIESLPTYLGLFKAYPMDKLIIKTLNVTAGDSFSYDNLLSIVINADIETNYTNNMDYYQGRIRYIKARTYDLNTGDEINLSDLFVNGTDYVKLLNDLVLLDAESKTEPNPTGYEMWYQYLGGFTGIRGDINFYLTPFELVLVFDQSYSEFYNQFSSAEVSIPFDKLEDVLAFQQRVASESNLFTDSKLVKYENFRDPSETQITVVRRDQTTIESTITLAPLSDEFTKIRDGIRELNQGIINQMVKDKNPYVSYHFSAVPVGPYMNVISTMYSNDHWDKINLTYKPDGTVLTFADVFKVGSEYKSIIIEKMKQIATENQFMETYDYEAIFRTMHIMVYGWQDNQSIRVFNTFAMPPDLNEGTFDIILDINSHQDILKLSRWSN